MTESRSVGTRSGVPTGGMLAFVTVAALALVSVVQQDTQFRKTIGVGNPSNSNHKQQQQHQDNDVVAVKRQQALFLPESKEEQELRPPIISPPNSRINSSTMGGAVDVDAVDTTNVTRDDKNHNNNNEKDHSSFHKQEDPTPIRMPQSTVSDALTRAALVGPDETFRIVTKSPTTSNGDNDKDDNHKHNDSDNCICDLISVDCIDSVRCLVAMSSQLEAHQAIVQGIHIRQTLKEMVTTTTTTTLQQQKDNSWSHAPMGKGLQYATIAAWRQWMRFNQLPVQLRSEPSIFVNETWYPPCRDDTRIRGKACFFQDVTADEDLHELERTALASVKSDASSSSFSSILSLQQLKADLVQFRNQSTFFGTTQQDNNNNNDNARSLRPPALAYLLVFAHVARMRFNLRPHMEQIYKQRLQSVIHVNNNKKIFKRKKLEHDSDDKDVVMLNVTLHLRRADACGHQQTGYETRGSKLSSDAQTSGKRKCYATSVYLKALNRTRALAPDNTIVNVYLATDHAGSVMEEIEQEFGDLYKQMNWFYLDYFSENTFQYKGFVEGNGMDRAKQARLGESAVADLFHASHGEVFIGHLGSRFGKVSWLLMTARHNRFVPFFSPDGHSYCCEIDEACAQVKPFITDMENCMTFSHEMAYDIPMNEPPEGYWEVGSRKREVFVQRQRDKARQQQL